MSENYDSVIHLTVRPACRRQYRNYEEAKKGARFSVKCAISSHPIFGIWQKVIAQTAKPLKIYFLPYIKETTNLVFRKT
jgi:hypothetical protein